MKTKKSSFCGNRFNFGRYKGKTIQEVFEIDPDYIGWAKLMGLITITSGG